MSVVFPNKKQRRKDCGLLAIKVATFVDYGTNDGERAKYEYKYNNNNRDIERTKMYSSRRLIRVGHVTTTTEIYIYLPSHTEKADHLLSQ